MGKQPTIEREKRGADSVQRLVGPTDLRTIIRVNDALKREHTMRSRLEGVRHQLVTLATTLQKSAQVK